MVIDHDSLVSILVLLFLANAIVTSEVLRDAAGTRLRKGLQCAAIWLLPFAGAAAVWLARRGARRDRAS